MSVLLSFILKYMKFMDYLVGSTTNKYTIMITPRNTRLIDAANTLKLLGI